MSFRYKLILSSTAIISGLIGGSIAVTPPVWGHAALMYLPQLGPIIVGLTAIVIALYNTDQKLREKRAWVKSAIHALIIELINVAALAKIQVGRNADNNKTVMTAGIHLPRRVILEGLSSELIKLPTEYLLIIAAEETILQDGMSALQFLKTKEKVKSQAVRQVFEHLEKNADKYVERLNDVKGNDHLHLENAENIEVFTNR